MSNNTPILVTGAAGSVGSIGRVSNIDIAIKLIKRMKGLFEQKIGLTFPSKETVLELNGCRIEAYPSNHIDAYRALDNPKFILLDAADLLYSKFLAYLIDQERSSKERKLGKKVIKTFLSKNGNSSSILWIERLLQTPLPKFRKYCVWRILAPYLINVKHLSFDEAFDIIDKWLDECNDLEALDFDKTTKVNDCLNGAVNIGYLPISFDNPLKEPRTLTTDNRDLYDLVKARYNNKK
jgi:hypothetical protein